MKNGSIGGLEALHYLTHPIIAALDRSLFRKVTVAQLNEPRG